MSKSIIAPPSDFNQTQFDYEFAGQIQICKLDPNNHQAVIDLVHWLHRENRDEKIKEVLDVEEISIGWVWHLLGKIFHARYNADGTVKNMALLERIFRRPIQLCLAAMDRARKRAELLVGILGDEQGFVQLLAARRSIQNELIRCLGLSSAPVRYMTNYWVRKIGHLGQIEFYFKSLTLGLLPPHRLIIICRDANEVSNLCLLEYWKQYIQVIIDPKVVDQLALESKILDADIHLFESAGKNVTYFYHKQAAALAWHQWETEGRPPLFSIEQPQYERGWSALKISGIPNDSWFVTFHVRESGFGNDLAPSPRNASIENYLPAMREVIARGGWAIRLGDNGMKPLPALPGLIDYAHSNLKSDWMDVFLLAACRCFVGVASGPAGIPPLFGVPCVYTNWMPMADYPYHGHALLIHKTHRDRSTGQKVPYSRFVSICSDYGTAFDRTNLTLDENTPEEIRDVLIEMLDDLDGKSSQCPRNDWLQSRFREIAGMNSGIGRPKLGRKFLEANATLL